MLDIILLILGIAAALAIVVFSVIWPIMKKNKNTVYGKKNKFKDVKSVDI